MKGKDIRKILASKMVVVKGRGKFRVLLESVQMVYEGKKIGKPFYLLHANNLKGRSHRHQALINYSTTFLTKSVALKRFNGLTNTFMSNSYYRNKTKTYR